MSAIMLGKNLKLFKEIKHIAMKLQFSRELLYEGNIKITHVRIEQQWAGFLINSTEKSKHYEIVVINYLILSNLGGCVRI